MGHDESNKDDAMEVDGQSKGSSATPGLTSKFSAEQIAQMRTKVQKNLKHQVKPLPVSTYHDEIADPLADLPFDDAGDTCTRALQECEQPSSSRAQLYSCVNSFDTINGYFNEAKVSHKPKYYY